MAKVGGFGDCGDGWWGCGWLGAKNGGIEECVDGVNEVGDCGFHGGNLFFNRGGGRMLFRRGVVGRWGRDCVGNGGAWSWVFDAVEAWFRC